MYSNLFQVAQKINTQAPILFPEDEAAIQRTSSVFKNIEPSAKIQIMDQLKNLSFNDSPDMLIPHDDEKIPQEERMNFYGNDQFAPPTMYGYYPYNYDTPGYNQNQYQYNYNDGYVPPQKPDLAPAKPVIRSIDLHDLNNKISNVTDQSDNYWSGKNVNLHDINNINDILNNKIENLDIIDDHEDGEDGNPNNLIHISNLITNITDKKKIEEDTPNFDNNNSIVTPLDGIIQNSFINSFVDHINKNQIDDLQDLLIHSKNYQDIQHEFANKLYSDKDFPADANSIYGFGERKDYSLTDLQQMPWLRPDQFFSGQKIRVFDKIEPTDIIQGGLGDCYFLAAIASIAEFPDRLSRVFLTKEPNKSGIYAVAICKDGLWQDVIVDDLFPCTKVSKQIAFNRSKSGELWVMLLEKAWAKMNGGYMNIAAGLTREALRTLTGASAITFFTANEREVLWKKLHESNNKKFIMTAGSDDLSNGSDAYVEKVGIAGSHAYSLLEAIEVEFVGGQYVLLTPERKSQATKIERIVKLRNPWGTGEWKGDWSDESKLWTPNLRQQLNYFSSDDGIFFMSYNDFCKYYSDCQICYYHDDYKYSALKIKSNNNDSVFLNFKLELNGLYYFSLNQKNKRQFPRNKNYNYSNLSFLVARIEKDGNITYLGGQMKEDFENWISFEAQNGEYYIYINTPWKSFVNEFSFSVYGPDKTDINRVTQEQLPENFIQKLFISHGKFSKEISNSFAAQGHSDISYKTFDNKGGFGYIYFENNSTMFSLEATVELFGSQNIKLCSPYSGLRPNLTVEPKKSGIIVYQAEKLPYSIQMRLMSGFKQFGKTEDLKELVRASKTILKRNDGDKELDIKVFVLYHAEGLAMLYVNNTTNIHLNEEIQFELVNAHIDDVYGSYIEISVPPKGEKLLKITKDKNATDFTSRVKNLSYKFLSK